MNGEYHQYPPQNEFQGNFNNSYASGSQAYSQYVGAYDAYDPLFNTARQIGGQFAEQQKTKISKYVSSFNLKYYFAVDTKYVARKLALIMFPFLHKDWTMKFSNDKPLTPREDINAPDLYIPLMAFITYILVAGFVFGVQRRFTPEKLGMLATNAMFYMLLENIIVFVTKYLLNISQSLNVWHALAYSSYKYVGMVVCLLLYLLFGQPVYYGALLYCICATVFFMLRTMKSFILDGFSGHGQDGTGSGRRRKIGLLLSIVVFQSLIMWLLTSSVTSYMPGHYDLASKMAKIAGVGLDQKNMPLTSSGEVDYEALLKMT